MTEEELTSFLQTGTLKVFDQELNSEEVSVSYCSSGVSAAGDHLETNADSQVRLIFSLG